jgi:hypothetical protein
LETLSLLTDRRQKVNCRGFFQLYKEDHPRKGLIFGFGMIKLNLVFDQTFWTGTGRS